jgi:transposase-like protein
MKSTTPEPFPCPFCRSARVAVIGAARRFLHYRCTTCEEVWTAMRVPSEPAETPSRKAVSERPKITCH